MKHENGEKSCLIRVMNTRVIWLKWKINVEQDLHFMRYPFSYYSSQVYIMIWLMQVVIWVMEKSWLDSNLAEANKRFMIRLMCNLWFEHRVTWFKSHVACDSTHNITKLLIFLVFSLIRLIGLCDTNHTPKILKFEVFKDVLRFYMWHDLNQSQLWFLFQKLD